MSPEVSPIPKEISECLDAVMVDDSRRAELFADKLRETAENILQHHGRMAKQGEPRSTVPVRVEYRGEAFLFWLADVIKPDSTKNSSEYLALKFKPQEPEWSQERFIFYFNTKTGRLFDDIDMEEAAYCNIKSSQRLSKIIKITEYIGSIYDQQN